MTVATLIATFDKYRKALPVALFLAIGKVESNFDPTAKNPNSTATGLFQFIVKTWDAYNTATGQKLPLTARTNLDEISKAEEWLLSVAVADLRKLGILPDWSSSQYPALLYLVHWTGAALNVIAGMVKAGWKAPDITWQSVMTQGPIVYPSFHILNLTGQGYLSDTKTVSAGMSRFVKAWDTYAAKYPPTIPQAVAALEYEYPAPTPAKPFPEPIVKPPAVDVTPLVDTSPTIPHPSDETEPLPKPKSSTGLYVKVAGIFAILIGVAVAKNRR